MDTSLSTSDGDRFNDFPEPPSVYGNKVAFLSNTASGASGVFLFDLSNRDAGYRRLVSTATKLAGVGITYIGFTRDAMTAEHASVYFVLSNQTYGVYRISLP